MLRIISLIATAGLLTATAGCMGGPGGPSRTIDWEQERAVVQELGQEATWRAQAGDAGAVLTGEGTASVEAPFTLRLTGRLPDDPGRVFFDANITGLGSGILMLEGETITITTGHLADAPVAHLTMAQRPHLALHEPFGAHGPDVSFPESHGDEQQALFFSEHVPASLTDWSYMGHDRALWFTGNQVEVLEGSVSFDATALHVDRKATLVADEVTLDMDRFAWAGAGSTGTVEVSGGASYTNPDGVFGRGATLVAAGDGISSKGSFTLTQVLDDGDWLVPAEVEARPEGFRHTVEEGGEAWVAVDIREKGYDGAAVLEDVSVTGDGASMVQVPVDDPPLHIERLWSQLEDVPGLAKPFAALAFVLASPAVVLVDVLEGIACAFSFCPHKHPYPVWMDPGTIDTFYVMLDGDTDPGTYDVTVTLHGANHADVSFDLQIEVVQPQS